MQKRLSNVIVLLSFILIICNSNVSKAASNRIEKTIIYFYSPTCSSCIDVKNYFKSLNDDINIISYDITEKNNKALLNSYCEYYKVAEGKFGVVPIVFVGEEYLFGREEIEEKLIDILENKYSIDTPLLKEGNYNHDIKTFESINEVTVFIAGIVNGLNPCSLSMLIFLLSLSSSKREKIVRVGMSFILGKFIGFLLLGVVFFNMLNSINFMLISAITKTVIIAFSLLFIILNIHDYIVISKNKYEKIKLKLPNKIISFNHKLIRNIEKKNKNNIFVVFYLILGFLISCGEFLCTGQIYLSTILTMINNNIYKHEAIYYFVLYNIAFIVPLVFSVFVISKLRDTFVVSNFLVNKMKYIKLINIIFFLIIIIYNIL